MYILLIPTYRQTTIQTVRTVAFPWQQWLRERATVLHFTHTVHILVFISRAC